jgi:hypothetical protein
VVPTSLPETVDQLIDILDQTYPNRCILPNETAEQAQRRAGSRDVVDWLLWLRARRDTDVLDKHKRF